MNRTKPVRKFVPVFIKLKYRDISIFLYDELPIEISNDARIVGVKSMEQSVGIIVVFFPTSSNV